jgi:NADH-quinone oxidoreductase subunit C
MEFDQLTSHIRQNFPEAQIIEDLTSTPESIAIEKSILKPLMWFLRDDEKCYFDLLSCLTGIDNRQESNTMEIAYNLSSIPLEHQLMIKVTIERDHPVIDTVSDIWRTADWHEREAYDLLGIRFEGHPDLRRILLPDDWEGHPLKKDYQLQEYYHGIKVEY